MAPSILYHHLKLGMEQNILYSFPERHRKFSKEALILDLQARGQYCDHKKSRYLVIGNQMHTSSRYWEYQKHHSLV